MKFWRSFFWSTVAIFLGLVVFGSKACAQDGLPDTPSPGSLTVESVQDTPSGSAIGLHSDSMVDTVCIAGSCGWKQVTKVPPAPTWIHRHPTLTKVLIISGLGTTGLIIGLKTRGDCKSSYNGFAYNGHENCPKSCDADGCYWGPK